MTLERVAAIAKAVAAFAAAFVAALAVDLGVDQGELTTAILRSLVVASPAGGLAWLVPNGIDAWRRITAGDRGGVAMTLLIALVLALVCLIVIALVTVAAYGPTDPMDY